MLVVGYGSIGKRHVQNLLEKKSLEVIVVTKQKIISKNSRLKIIHNLDDALKEKPDIGFVTNETRFHLPTAIKLARKYDNEFPENDFEEVLQYLNLNEKKFYEIVDKHRNHEIWKTGLNNKWELINSI